MKMKSTIVLTIAGLLAASTALAQDKTVTFRFSHWVPPTHPLVTKAMMPWAAAVTKDSGGTIKFQWFHAGQLGKAEDHYDMVRDGIADAGWLNPGFNAGRWPVFAAIQVPMQVSNAIGGTRALHEWYEKYAAKEMGEVKVCIAHTMHPLSFHSTKRIVLPKDLNGLKIRPSSAMEALYIRNAGGATVPGVFPKARDLIARGVADGTTGVFGSLIAFGIDKATKYHLNMPFSVAGYVVVLNKSKYDALSPKQKKAVDSNCTADASVRFAEPVNKFDADGIIKLKARKDGREVIDITPEQLKVWQSRLGPVKEAWAKDVKDKGYAPDTVFDELTAALNRNKASTNQ